MLYMRANLPYMAVSVAVSGPWPGLTSSAASGVPPTVTAEPGATGNVAPPTLTDPGVVPEGDVRVTPVPVTVLAPVVLAPAVAAVIPLVPLTVVERQTFAPTATVVEPPKVVAMAIGTVTPPIVIDPAAPAVAAV
jgi:hypothetical protein